MTYLAMWRATGMWYGYASSFDESAGVDPLPMRLVLYSLIPMLAVLALLDKQRMLLVLKKSRLSVVAVCIVCVLSLAASLDRNASLRGLVAVALLAAPPLLFRARFGSIETYKLICRFIYVTAIANFIYTFAFPQFSIMGGSYAGMVKGLFYHKNGLGQFCSMAIVILAVKPRIMPLSYSGILRFFVILILLGLLLASQSSTAVVTMSIGLMMIMGLHILGRIRGATTRLVILLYFTVMIVAVAGLALMGVASLIAAVFDKDLTFSGRTDIWDFLLPLVYDRPLLGYGFASFRQASIIEQYVSLSHTVNSLHNTYLEISLNIGVPGMILWVSSVIAILVQKYLTQPANPLARSVRNKEIAVITLILIGGFTEAGFMLAPVVFWPFFVALLPANVEPLSPLPQSRTMLKAKRYDS